MVMQFFRALNLTDTALTEITGELKKSGTDFVLELAKENSAKSAYYFVALPINFNIGKIKHWQKYLAPTQDHSIFNKKGVHLMNYLKFKNVPKLEIRNLTLEIPAQADEGYAIQYHFLFARNNYQLNVKTISSAPSFLRASEILDQLNLPFGKDFKIIKPNSMSEGITHYAYRQFQEKYKFEIS